MTEHEKIEELLNDDEIRDVIDKTMLEIIYILLEEKEISEDDNIDDIVSVIFDKEGDIPMHEMVFYRLSYVEELQESLKLELEHRHYMQVMTLTFTCIEHMLNLFYRTYFEEKLKMTDSQIESLLKNNGVSEKIDALYYLTFNENFPSDIGSKIKELKSIRNKFVHYKAESKRLEQLGDANRYNEEVRLANICPEIVLNLQKFITEKEKIFYHNRIIAQNILQRMLDRKKELNNGQA